MHVINGHRALLESNSKVLTGLQFMTIIKETILKCIPWLTDVKCLQVMESFNHMAAFVQDETKVFS